MKKFIMVLVCLMAITMSANAQVYEREKPLYVLSQHGIHLCGEYKINTNSGLYEYVDFGEDKVADPDKFLDYSNGNEHFFIVDKKSNKFYFYSDNYIGYYSPNKKWGTDIINGVKNTNVPLVTSESINDITNIARNALNKIYDKKNDSIISYRNEVIRKNNEKRINDSIEEAKRNYNELNEYRKTHSWRDLVNFGLLQCKSCNDLFSEIKVLSINADTVFFFKENNTIILGETYAPYHYTVITEKNKELDNYKKIWKDSIEKNKLLLTTEVLERLNEYNRLNFLKNIIKKAPYGYIENWGWELNSADGIEPYFSYRNTSSKTIKYVDFYFSVFNQVGDKCFLRYNNSYVGHVRGVGPVSPYESASWNWDSATHYTSGDASEMRVVKLVITYMDKTTKILTGNNIKFE